MLVFALRSCLRAGGDNIAANGVRCLGPRIVIGDKDQIGQFGGSGPHHRPLAGITITTGTKQHGKPVASLGAQRHQCGAQGVRRPAAGERQSACLHRRGRAAWVS